MADKKSPLTGSFPNPLQRMFGTFLRLERRRLELETSSVAREMGLAETYYRLVESGRATFNQGLIFKLLELLANNSARRGELAVQIHFHRLALYLVGAQYVGAEMAEMTKAGATERVDLLAVEELALRDADFEMFHRETKEYYSFSENDDKQRRFLEETAAPRVAEFLTSIAYVRPTGAQIVEQVMPDKTLLALPTLNIEIITRLVVDLGGRPFVHTPHLAAAWEDRASRQIRTVRGIYQDADMIVGENNLSVFHYPYLTEKHFSDLRFIFLCSNPEYGSSEKLKTLFIDRLNRDRVTIIDDEHAKRINFKLLSESQLKRYKSEIDEIRARSSAKENSGPHKAYWSFEIAMGTARNCRIPIGFVGSDGEGAADIWNLDLEDSSEKGQNFDRLWDVL